MPSFSLLPCSQCQAPAGWGRYNEVKDGIENVTLRCHVCKREISATSELEAAEKWNEEFVIVMPQAQLEAIKQENENRIRQGLPTLGPRPKIVQP